MISAAYLDQQQKLHCRADYGISGQRYAQTVDHLATKLGTHDILDYGCGKRTLESALGYFIRNYDPAIPELAESPKYPADIVVCTDVLEHIEPEMLDDVLDDLQRLTRKLGMFVIATGPAKKVLEDGRNAHLIQEGESWWMPKLKARFDVLETLAQDKCFTVLVKPC